MQFENTYNLLWLLLLIPAVALLYLVIRWKRVLKEKLGDSRLVANLFTGILPKAFLIKGLLSIVALLLLVLALTNLRRPDSSEKVKLTGTDLMIALDVSNSMLATDIQPSRLDKAKLLISKLIDQLQGNRIGLVVFAGNAYLQMPLTTDASAARLFLSTISPGLVPYQGTNISEALQVCNRSFNTGEKKYKSILLISDGEDHDNTTLETAEKLKGEGVVINTVGIGSPQGTTLVDPTTGQARRDQEGNVVISKLNQADLEKIATTTSGTYNLLTNTDVTASDIGKELSAMDQKAISDTTLTNFTSYYWWFVTIAALLLITELLVSEKTRQMKLKKPAITTFLLLCISASFAQQKQSQQQVRKGNEAYRKQDFDGASKDYEQALKSNTANTTASFNLGNSRFRSGKYDDATKQYDALSNSSADKKLQASSLYNKGLANVKQQKLEEAIQNFKQSLRLNPDDEETRQNLQKALNEKKQQDQQQQQKDKDDKKKKKNDKKDKQDQKNKPEDPNKDKNQPPEKQQQQPPPKINKQDAEQKLQALRQEEKKLQQKLNDRQPTSVRQAEKDW